MLMKDKEMHVLHRQLLLSSVAILLILGLIAFTGSLIFKDIVQQQNIRYYQLALDFTNDATEQIYTDIKNLFDQMLFSPQFDKLMNYKNVDYTDLLIGLKQLGYCQKSNNYVDSIYLYNAQNDTFYITSDYSTQAVQTTAEMFDKGAVDIILNIHDYSNLAPVERTAVYAFPFYKEVNYITFIRYNVLSKGKTNVYIINIEAEKLGRIASALRKSDEDRLFFANGEAALLGQNADESMNAAARAVYNTDSDTGFIELNGQIAVYDKTLPFDWTLIYISSGSDSSIASGEAGVKRIALLVVLAAILVVMFILALMHWIRIIRKKNNEARVLEEDRKRMERLAVQHNVLKAMADNNISLLPDQIAKICRLIMLSSTAHSQDTVANGEQKRMFLQSLRGDSIVFNAEDNENRHFICIRDDDGIIETLAEPNETLFCAVSDEFAYPFDLYDAYQWCTASAEYGIISKKRVFTSEELSQHESYKHVPQDAYTEYAAALQNLDEASASEKLHHIVQMLANGEIHNYKMGIMKLVLQTSNTLSQLIQPSAVASNIDNVIDNKGITSLKPEEAYTRINVWVCQVIRDVLDIRNSRYDKLASDIIDYIEKNCSDSDFSAESVAKEFGFSAQYLSRVFKKQTGDGISECITAARIRKAKMLLAASDEPITQIASACGFLDAQYFHRVFKSRTGMTPGAYRQESQNESREEGGQNG